MDSSQRPFQPRELLRHLPELLEGAEPEVLKPAARQMLKSDPMARAAVASIAMLASTSSSGRSMVGRFRRQIDKSIRKNIDQGGQVFSDVMSRMLLSSGLGHLEVATSNETYFSGISRSATVIHTVEDYRSVEEELREGLGVSSDTCLDLVLASVAKSDDGDQAGELSRAQVLLEAAAGLVPGDATIEFYLIQASNYHTPETSLDSWEKYARLNRARDVIGRGIHECGRAHLDLGDYGVASRYIQQAERYLPRSAEVAYNGLVASLCTGNRKLAMRQADTFVALSQDDGFCLDGFLTGTRGLATEWRHIMVTSAIPMKTVLAALPIPLTRVVEEVIS